MPGNFRLRDKTLTERDRRFFSEKIRARIFHAAYIFASFFLIFLAFFIYIYTHTSRVLLNFNPFPFHFLTFHRRLAIRGAHVNVISRYFELLIINSKLHAPNRWIIASCSRYVRLARDVRDTSTFNRDNPHPFANLGRM